MALQIFLARRYADLTAYELRTFLRAAGLKRFALSEDGRPERKMDLVVRLARHDAAAMIARSRGAAAA